MIKFIYWAISILILIFSSCQEKEKVLATIDKKEIYQSQVDSIIKDEIEKLREQALKSYVSRKLFELEANKRKLSIDELKDVEIIQKSKKVTHNEIIKYSHLNNIKHLDSIEYLSIKEQLININRRFRFLVFIDSLKEVYNASIIYNHSNKKLVDIDNIHSHITGNNTSKLHLYIIADYDCSSCKDNYERIYDICMKYIDKIQFHFVYYSCIISDNAILAEAIANQGKFWDFNTQLFQINQVNDSIISNIIQSYSLDSSKFWFDFKNRLNEEKLVNNQKILEGLKIYSVPTIIIDNEIIPGYTSSEELIQIINYKILNQ